MLVAKRKREGDDDSLGSRQDISNKDKLRISRLQQFSEIDAHSWDYLAEGGANVVFSYVGGSKDYYSSDNSLLFSNHILRIPKSKEGTPSPQDVLEYSTTKLLPLLNEQTRNSYYSQAAHVATKVPPSFIRALEQIWIKHPKRRHNNTLPSSECKLNGNQVMILLQMMHTNKGFMVELKPKCGIIHGTTVKTSFLKQTVCRYCMHQELKVLKEKKYSRRKRRYCPLDLFSSEKSRIVQALLSLVSDPQNNLKTFGNTNFFESTEELCEMTFRALSESKVLQDVKAIQKLNGIDIDLMYKLYQMNNNESALDNNLIDLLESTEEFPQLYLQTLNNFLIAKTVKDCSILISFNESDNGDNTNSSSSFSLGNTVSCTVAIVDLDIKSENSLEKYYKLDQEILRHYVSRVGLHSPVPCVNTTTTTTKSPDHTTTLRITNPSLMCRLLYPNPVCLLSIFCPTSLDVNVMTITWLTPVDNNGNFVCSINRSRWTASNFLQNGVDTFVLNIPSCQLEQLVLDIGSTSGKDVDKVRELDISLCTPGWKPTVLGKKKREVELNDRIKHSVALTDCVAHTVCRVNKNTIMTYQSDKPSSSHLLLSCTQTGAWVRNDYFDGKNFLPKNNAPPYMTFLGSKTFGYVVSRDR